MELRHLRYFVAVAEELNFSRAAARLRIAQPPLSRQIRDLERDVGTALFERVPRGVELTAAGSAFLGEARLTLAQAERARRTAQRAARGETGRLRVGFVETATQSGILPDVLRYFRTHLPSVGLSLFELDPPRQMEAFRDGRIDVGVTYGPPAAADRWLRAEEFHREPVVVALPRAHRLARRQRLTISALAAEPFVLFARETAPAMYDDVVTSCRAAGFSPQVIQEATGWHTVASLVGAGTGIGIVPQSLAAFRHPGVIYRSIRSVAAELVLVAIWDGGRRSPVRERFVTALRAVAGAVARGGR